MYKRKTPLDLSCGIRITMEIIGSKWKPCLIDALRETPKRPSQLHREIPEAISRARSESERARSTRHHRKENICRTTSPQRIRTDRIRQKCIAFDRHTG